MDASAPNWDERYAEGDLPWDTGRHDRNLERIVQQRPIAPCRTLELGCGTGSNAVWLARQGFDVFGIDLSPLAVERACERSRQAGVTADFLASDVFQADVAVDAYSFAFDRGCFHSFPDSAQRDQFVAWVHQRLADGGLWFSLIGSKDSPPREMGPPMLSAREVLMHVEPYFEVLSLTATHFDSEQSLPPAAWACLMRKRNPRS